MLLNQLLLLLLLLRLHLLQELRLGRGGSCAKIGSLTPTPLPRVSEAKPDSSALPSGATPALADDVTGE